MHKEIKLLHIASDEKFINSAYFQFEKIYPGANLFKIYTYQENHELKHVNKEVNHEVINVNTLDINDLVNEFKHYDLVLMHGLNMFQSGLILKAQESTKIIWFFWGGEIYNHDFEPLGTIYGDKTKKVFDIKSSGVIKNFLKTILRPLKYRIFYKRHYYHTLSAVKKTKFVSTQFKEDFDNLLLNKLIKKNAINVKFSYYPIEFIFKDNRDLRVNGNNILIGNSASPTNNHLETFDLLKKINLDDRKIVVPLSYGDMAYAEEIKKIGKSMFDGNFNPLINFLKLTEYNKIVQQCGITILNSYRQQAIGNVMAMIWMGSKVYLDEKNTVYSYLKRIGVIVFSINRHLNNENDEVFTLLKSSEIKNNRDILESEIGIKALQSSLKKDIDYILGN